MDLPIMQHYLKLQQELVNTDIVISPAASQLPILGKGAVESALKQRRHKPMFMVDIAVPRDIEPEVGELEDIYLYSVDDLHEVVSENLKSRQGAADAAEQLVVLVRQRKRSHVSLPATAVEGKSEK